MTFAFYQLEVDKSFERCNFPTTLTFWITWTELFVLPWISKTYLPCVLIRLLTSSRCHATKPRSTGHCWLSSLSPFPQLLPISYSPSQFLSNLLTCSQSGDLIGSPLILAEDHNFLLWTTILACSHGDVGLPNILQTPRDEREEADARSVNTSLQPLYEKGKFLRKKIFLLQVW